MDHYMDHYESQDFNPGTITVITDDNINEAEIRLRQFFHPYDWERINMKRSSAEEIYWVADDPDRHVEWIIHHRLNAYITGDQVMVYIDDDGDWLIMVVDSERPEKVVSTWVNKDECPWYGMKTVARYYEYGEFAFLQDDRFPIGDVYNINLQGDIDYLLEPIEERLEQGKLREIGLKSEPGPCGPVVVVENELEFDTFCETRNQPTRK